MGRVWEVMGARRTGPDLGAALEPLQPKPSWPGPVAGAMVNGKRQRLTRKSSAEELTPKKKNPPVAIHLDLGVSSKAGAPEAYSTPFQSSTTGLLPKNAEFLQKLCG